MEKMFQLINKKDAAYAFPSDLIDWKAENVHDVGKLLRASLAFLWSTDKDKKFSTPLLDVKSRQLVLEANKTLVLNCR